MSQNEYKDKFREALKHLNSASEQLCLAWNLVQEAGKFNSAESLFHEFKESILYSGDFEKLYLFIISQDGYCLSTGQDEDKSIKDKREFNSIEEIKKEFKIYYEKENIQIEEIIIGNKIYGVLVAITKTLPKMITYNSIGLLKLFLNFIRLKAIEIRDKNHEAYRKAISEKVILINEHLMLQKLWTGKVSRLIDRLSQIKKKMGSQFKDDQISEILEELESDVLPLQNLNRSTRDVVKSFGYYEAQKPVFFKTGIKSLFREVQIHFSRESLNQEFLRQEVFVDPEQMNEGIKQVVYVLQSFFGNSEISLEILPYNSKGSRVSFGVGSRKIESWWLKDLDKGKRHWEESGPVVTGLTLQALDLAVNLIKKSKGGLNINKGEKDTLSGFEIDLPLYKEKKNEKR